MSIQDKDLGSGTPLPAASPQESGKAAAGAELPVAKKRIMFRYWLGAIAVGALLWAGIAFGLGLV